MIPCQNFDKLLICEQGVMESSAQPSMAISFSETKAYVEAHNDEKGKEEASAEPELPPKPVLHHNVLLSREEMEELRKQEIMSSFLIGVGVGATAVGTYFLVRWILKRGQTSFLETALEKSF